MRRSSLCIVFGSQQFVIKSPEKSHSTSSHWHMYEKQAATVISDQRERLQASGEGLPKLAYQVCG